MCMISKYLPESAAAIKDAESRKKMILIFNKGYFEICNFCSCLETGITSNIVISKLNYFNDEFHNI